MSRRWLVGAVVALLVPAAGAAYGGPHGTGTPCEDVVKPPPPKCANGDCADPLFSVSHPPRGTYVSAHCAELAIPFAIYDGKAALLLGSAHLAALEAIAVGSGYRPVATHDGGGIAAVMVSDFPDTNAGPYREVLVAFLVNEATVTVSTRNPYAYLAEALNPHHTMWMQKLILTEQMPIDWGREVVGYDKNPDPQHIDIRTTADDTTFAAKDPGGKPILSGRLFVDNHPTVQARAASQTAAAGGEWLKPALKTGGLIQVNIVSPDVLRRGQTLKRSYGLVRVKSRPALGMFGPESRLTADPTSDFGAALTRMDFRPVVSARLAVRILVDTGFAP